MVEVQKVVEVHVVLELLQIAALHRATDIQVEAEVQPTQIVLPERITLPIAEENLLLKRGQGITRKIGLLLGVLNEVQTQKKIN